MYFDQIIKHILKEEVPSRKDRISALDNLEFSPRFEYVLVKWMGSEDLPIQQLRKYWGSKKFPYCVTQYFVGDIDNLVDHYIQGQYKKAQYKVFFINIQHTRFEILDYMCRHSEVYGGDFTYNKITGYGVSYIEYADAKDIALASPEFDDPF
jgi:hypothetical protein